MPLAADVLTGLQLSRGVRQTFEVLHGLALFAVAERGHTSCPNTLTLHLPQRLLAEHVGYTTRYLRRLLAELTTAGVLDWGAHASKGSRHGLALAVRQCCGNRRFRWPADRTLDSM
jgi:hypothetical protein